MFDLIQTYKLAIKEFSAGSYEDFKREVGAYDGLQRKPGIVHLLGTFVHRDGIFKELETYNMLFEFGQINLQDFFVFWSRPLLGGEIVLTWRDFALPIAQALVHVHENNVGETQYLGYYALILLQILPR